MPADSRHTRPTFKKWLSLRLAWLIGQWVRVMPRPAMYWIADHSGTAVYNLFPTYRRNVASNVAHVLGPNATDDEVDDVTRRVFQTSGRNFCDLLLVPYLSERKLRETVRFSEESRERLDRALAQGKGVVAVTAHFGAFDYVGQILVMHGYHATALTTRTVPEFFYYAVKHLRGFHGFGLEEATPGGVRRAIASLKRGGIVALAADRDFFQSGPPATFFGRATTLPPGPPRIARQTGAPIVAVLASRRTNGYELTVEPPFQVERTADADADVRQALAKIVTIFERYIRDAPEQWVMFQRVWPEHAAPALRVFPVGSPLEGEILGRGSDEIGPLTAPPDLPTDRMGSPLSPSPAPAPQRAAPPE